MEKEQGTFSDQDLENIGLNTKHFPSLTAFLEPQIRESCQQIHTSGFSQGECSIEKELLMHAIEILQDMYLVIDIKKKNIVRWNNVVKELTGFTQTITLQDLFPEKSQKQIFEALPQTNTDNAVTIVTEVATITGEKIPVSLRLSCKMTTSNINYITAIGRDLRSVVASNQKLIESRNKYESIFNSTEDGLVVFDPMNGVVDCNHSALQLFNYPAKEAFLNTSFLSISTPTQICNTNSSLLFKEYLEDIILFGTKVFKWKFIKCNGKSFPASVAISKFIYEGKTLFNARITDISLEQKRLELLFMERNVSISLQSENSTESILTEAMDHLLTLSDIEAGIAFATSSDNEYFEIISNTGLKVPHKILCTTFSQLIHDSSENEGCYFISKNDSNEIPTTIFESFETTIWIPQYYNEQLTSFIVLFSDELSLLNSEMKSAMDIVSGIIQNAIVRCKAEEEVRSSEERHRNYVENAPYGIFLSNFEDKILDVNSAACTITHRSKTELLSMNIADLIAYNKRSEFSRSMQKVKLSGLFFGEYPVESTEKDERFWSINTVKLSDDQALSFIKDISKIKELEMRISQKEKMEAIGQLAGGIAHDFNNQLTGIIGYSELLKDSLKDNDELTEYINFILMATQRSSEITSQLLAYARKGKYITKSLDIHVILHEVIDLLKHTIDKRIVLKKCFVDKKLKVRGDSAQLQNMFLNLAINARDAMPKGGTLEFITTELSDTTEYTDEKEFHLKPGNYVKIVVKDTGSGMSEDIRRHVFEPFFTTKEKGKGTGMGLAAAYGTIKNHKGYIKIVSEVGSGTEFHLFLPMADENSIDEHTIESLEKADIKVYGNGNILIIDDDELICNTLSNSLQKLGYQTSVFYNGLDALDYYKTHWMSINLIILDMVMPFMSGKDTFFELKKINENCHVVISSGYTSDKDVEELLHLGALKFIQKPYSINNISSTIYDLIHA